MKKIAIPTEYLDCADVFLQQLAAELSEQSNINQLAINIETGKQSPSKLIYSLKLIELDIFKIYIKTNLINSFIQPFKFPARALIFFVQKFDISFYLYVNYWGLNYLTIENWYFLLLIGKLFN